MKKKIFLLLFTALFLFFSNSFSQISEKGIPPSFNKKKNSKINYVNLNAPDISNIKNKNGKILQFAKKIELDISIKESLYIYINNTTESVWQLGITAKDALSLNLTFSDFKIPKGAKLFVYSANKKIVLGAFTSKNNKESKILPILPINSDSIVIEYSEPQNVKFQSKLKISSVGYGFVDILETNLEKSGSCNIDIRCNTGLPWYVEKRAVAKMYIDNQYICTGSLINNTKNDETPYFLTANHCLSTESFANNTVFYFNYEHTSCDGTEVDDTHSLAGSNLIATPENDNQIDFALLKLSTAVPAKYIPYYAGWNISSTPANTAVTIHHPDGDVKKISITNTTLQTTSDAGYISNTHWLVSFWDLGTTEGGSSGAPLFNEKHQIIGDLTGGEASCDKPNEWDIFAKFSSSWNYFSETNRQLKHWLNPDNLDISELNGFEPFPLSSDNDAEIIEIISPKGNYCLGDFFTPTVLIRNLSNQNLNTLDIDYFIDNQLINSVSWSGNLKAYEIEEVEFPQISRPIGEYELLVSIKNPNSQIDVNLENNSLITFFNVIEGLNYQLSITTDDYASETSWEILNKNNEIVFSGGSYANNTNYIYDLCLDSASCYTFKIIDDAADGICCEYGSGNFKMLDENNEIVFEGGSFSENSESHLFCTLGLEEKIEKLSFYPNPVIDYLSIEAADFSDLQYEIYTLMGAKLLEGKLSLTKNKISFNGYNSGIYIVKIYNNNELKQYYKVLKQ